MSNREKSTEKKWASCVCVYMSEWVWDEDFTLLHSNAKQRKNGTKLFVSQCFARCYFCWLPLFFSVSSFYCLHCVEVFITAQKYVFTEWPYTTKLVALLFVHFHYICKCCHILKKWTILFGHFVYVLRISSLIRWMMAHLRLYYALQRLLLWLVLPTKFSHNCLPIYLLWVHIVSVSMIGENLKWIFGN